MNLRLADLAREIATSAHAGQFDKIGNPYIDHPRRVAARLTDEHEVAAAWLHDVIEDCDVTADELRTRGVPDEVVAAVEALTRLPGQGDDYYRVVRANPIALAVKRADIADNTDPDRVRLLDAPTAAKLKAKYEHALALLNGRTPSRSEDQ